MPVIDVVFTGLNVFKKIVLIVFYVRFNHIESLYITF